jgi:hypothetical protein
MVSKDPHLQNKPGSSDLGFLEHLDSDRAPLSIYVLSTLCWLCFEPALWHKHWSDAVSSTPAHIINSSLIKTLSRRFYRSTPEHIYSWEVQRPLTDL